MLLPWNGLCFIAKRRSERSQTSDSDHEEYPTSTSNEDITSTDASTPEFLAELYKCWQEREYGEELSIECSSDEEREQLESAHVIRGYVGDGKCMKHFDTIVNRFPYI